MEGLIECLVKRKAPLTTLMLRVLMIGVTVCTPVLLFLLFPSYLFVEIGLLALLILVTWLVFRNTNLEYEYAYFEGELAVDKIMSRSTRKKLHRFDITKMEYMAPADSPRLFNMRGRKAYQYSTLNPDDASYAIVTIDEKNNPCVLYFTPNEELLECIKRNYPRKIYED